MHALLDGQVSKHVSLRGRGLRWLRHGKAGLHSGDDNAAGGLFSPPKPLHLRYWNLLS